MFKKAAAISERSKVELTVGEEIYYDTLDAHYCLNLCGKTKHKVELGSDALGKDVYKRQRLWRGFFMAASRGCMDGK